MLANKNNELEAKVSALEFTKKDNMSKNVTLEEPRMEKEVQECK